MAGSADEREIRDAVAARLRELFPDARIVHELNCSGQGSCRIDLAAVTSQVIVAAEIKSKKDTLERLEDQWRAFGACCHHVVVAAHDKHFRDTYDEYRRPDLPPLRVLNHPLFVDERGRARWCRHNDHVWPYPRPPVGRYGEPSWAVDVSINLRRQPQAYAMLNMLWAEELRVECARHGIAAHARRARHPMMLDMAWMMTGKEIAEAVCRQLRQRSFPEADAPIMEQAA